MANSKQSEKRARQSVQHRDNNRWQRSRMTTNLKRVAQAIEQGVHTDATVAYREAVSLLDRLVSKRIIHANKAARHKSRINARLKAIA
ncbi:MAG: 30S ribosomal protein S20 [Methylocystaceae bacterium]|nr:30S ribosomal protein S20 [Methylocystaceae bacterium]